MGATTTSSRPRWRSSWLTRARRSTRWICASTGVPCAPDQTIGYADDLSAYDEEIGEAIEIIRSEREDEPIVLMGHSTGGLIATLWAHRHPGRPGWPHPELGLAGDAVDGRLARGDGSRHRAHRVAQPMWEVPSGGTGHYGRSLAGRASSELPIPEGLSTEDPSVAGWPIIQEWKRPHLTRSPPRGSRRSWPGTTPSRSAYTWTGPVLSMVSTSAYFEEEWCERVFTSDTVLDPTVIAQRSLGLSDLVTIARFPASTIWSCRTLPCARPCTRRCAAGWTLSCTDPQVARRPGIARSRASLRACASRCVDARRGRVSAWRSAVRAEPARTRARSRG